jgi:hypothetical protein
MKKKKGWAEEVKKLWLEEADEGNKFSSASAERAKMQRERKK